MNGSAVSGVWSLLRRLREEGGFNLVELVTTMAIMLFVITAPVQLLDVRDEGRERPEQAAAGAEEARLGLDTFRRGPQRVRRDDLGRRHAGHADDQRHERARQLPVHRRGLELVHERQCDALRPLPPAGNGACGTGDVRADYLTTAAIFRRLGRRVSRRKVQIDMTVNREPTVPRLRFRLHDAIALRNARRT